MDIESRRTESVPAVRGAELPLHMAHETMRFCSIPERESRILRLARDRNPSNILPDKLCRCGAVLFLCLAAADLLIWGLVFGNTTMLLTFWAVLSAGMALPVLMTLYVRQAFGLASRLHRYHNPTLTLAADRLILEMKCHKLFRGKNSPTLRREFLYSRINGLEYDRTGKTLRLSSTYTNGDSPSLELVMMFEHADQIVREIEKRSGVFIRPAMRGDDYADLRDLPGLKPERGLLRPLSVAALLFSLTTLLSVLAIRSHNAKNPYVPFPKTAEFFLTGHFSAGDTVTLDGCNFTLSGVTRAGSDARGVCYQFLVTMNNGNASPIRLRTDEPYKNSPANIIFTGLSADGTEFPLETSGPPLGHVGVHLPCPSRLPTGKNVNVTFFVWVPANAAQVELTINSDYWPPGDLMRDVTYTGGYTVIGGQTVKDNEVRFTVDRTDLE